MPFEQRRWADLAAAAGRERHPFKTDERKLKEPGSERRHRTGAPVVVFLDPDRAGLLGVPGCWAGS